ncbi:MAG: FecR domain-containing protein [Treponema sp.]|nr:FecR domain-containing protein [Treponema sp.]MBP5577020.1 FecR domain-containing protein [Treponema sp.]
MKKTLRVLLALALAFVAAHSALALEATVVSTSGKVEIQRGNSWVPLNKGDVVYGGAVISTGFKSSAELDIHGSKVQLGPLTRITIEKLVSTSTKNESSIYLDSGRVDAAVNKADGKRTGFRVSTPVATASVRGTYISMTAGGGLGTGSGMSVMTPPVSSAPQITDTPSNYTPADSKTSVFTSVKDICGGIGIPVSAGESTTPDANTGLPVYPQRHLARKISDIRSGTVSLTFQEKVAPPVVGVPSVRADLPESGAGANPGTLVVTVTF